MRNWVFGAFMLSGVWLFSQPTAWTLEDCIQYAVEHNITVQQAALNVQSNQSQLQTAKFALLPNLNASSGLFFNWGRFVDPTTNDFITENTNATSINLNSSITLFSGGQLRNTIKQNQSALASSKAAMDNAELSIAIAITQAYLNVLLTQENLQVAREQLAINKSQVEMTEKMVKAGQLPEGNLLEAKAQLAQSTLQEVDARTQHDLALLNLQLTMLRSPSPDFSVAPYTDTIDPQAIAGYAGPEELFQKALSVHPAIAQREEALQSARFGLAATKGNYYPTLSLNGGLGTTSSSARKNFEQVITGVDTIAVTVPSGDFVVAPEFTVEENPYPFTDQWQDNLNRQVGLSLQIPIFNRNQVKNAVNQAAIRVQAAELDHRQQMNQLRQEVYNAYYTALANSERYQAAQINLTATRRAFEYAQKRAEQGVMSPFDFNIAQNNLNIAQANFLQAKYQYLLSLKVLDYNIGKQLNWE